MAPLLHSHCGLLSRFVLYSYNGRLLDTRLLDLLCALHFGTSFGSESHLVHRMPGVGLRCGFPLEQSIGDKTPHLVQLRGTARDDNLATGDTAIAQAHCIRECLFTGSCTKLVNGVQLFGRGLGAKKLDLPILEEASVVTCYVFRHDVHPWVAVWQGTRIDALPAATQQSLIRFSNSGNQQKK